MPFSLGLLEQRTMFITMLASPLRQGLPRANISRSPHREKLSSPFPAPPLSTRKMQVETTFLVMGNKLVLCLYARSGLRAELGFGVCLMKQPRGIS